MHACRIAPLYSSVGFFKYLGFFFFFLNHPNPSSLHCEVSASVCSKLPLFRQAICIDQTKGNFHDIYTPIPKRRSPIWIKLWSIQMNTFVGMDENLYEVVLPATSQTVSGFVSNVLQMRTPKLFFCSVQNIRRECTKAFESSTQSKTCWRRSDPDRQMDPDTV